MAKPVKRRSEKAGLPPGEAVYVGEGTGEVLLTIIDYGPDAYTTKVAGSVEECALYRERPGTTWINVDGLHEVPIIEHIGECFGIHPLTVEDILNTEQRPKMDVSEDYIYVVVNMLTYDRGSKEIESEQMSMILGRNFVLTFQEKKGDIFDVVRDRLRTNKGRIRKEGADYLAYSLLDTIIDNYFKVLEDIGEDIEDVEEEVVANPDKETIQSIHFLKREIIYLRRSVWPLREITGRLERGESNLVRPSTSVYLRDLYDHTVQVVETVETYRDLISGMLDIYLSSVSNRLNEVMKVLTIFAAIFIPLTFIAGVYGMNFKTDASPLNMPELGMYYGYPMALGLMLVVALVMLALFKKKKWF